MRCKRGIRTTLAVPHVRLLDYIRKDAKHKKIPIVAAIVARMSMSFETMRGLAYATKIIVDALLLPPDVVPEVAESLSP